MTFLFLSVSNFCSFFFSFSFIALVLLLSLKVLLRDRLDTIIPPPIINGKQMATKDIQTTTVIELIIIKVMIKVSGKEFSTIISKLSVIHSFASLQALISTPYVPADIGVPDNVSSLKLGAIICIMDPKN